jgi:hypothetical protein
VYEDEDDKGIISLDIKRLSMIRNLVDRIKRNKLYMETLPSNTKGYNQSSTIKLSLLYIFSNNKPEKEKKCPLRCFPIILIPVLITNQLVARMVFGSPP